jgi:dihydrodipicolinate reductase
VEADSYLEDVKKLQEELGDAEHKLRQEQEKERSINECPNIPIFVLECASLLGLQAVQLEQEAEIIELRDKKTSSTKVFNNSDLKR